MAEAPIICSKCKKALIVTFIEISDLTFCSNKCFGEYVTMVGRENFQKEYGTIFMLDHVRNCEAKKT